MANSHTMQVPRASALAASPWTLVAVLGAALSLRLPGLFSLPFWRDERYTLAQVRDPFTELLQRGATFHPPGYPALAKLAAALLPHEAAIRVPALLGGLLAVAAGYGLARALAGVGAGLATGLALALSVYLVAYSQEARGYSWMSALSGVACALAIAHVRAPSPAKLTGALCAALGAAGFHFLALPSSAAVVVGLLAVDARRLASTDRRSVTVWVVFLVAAALSAVLLREAVATILDYVPATASTRLAPSPQFFAQLGARWSGAGPIAGAVLGLLAVVGLVRAARLAPAVAGLLAAALLAPFATVVLVPWSRSFEARYLMAALVPAAALSAAGAVELLRWLRAPERVAAGLLAAATLALLALQLPVTAAHVAAPAKYSPATGSSAFGLRHVILHGITDPWLVVSTTEADFNASPRVVGKLRLPLPAWGQEWLEERPGGELHARFRNLRADEFVNVVARTLDGPVQKPAEDTLLATTPTLALDARAFTRRVGPTRENGWMGTYTHPGTGAPVGYRELSWYCAKTGRQFWVTVRSTRLELSLAYLEQVARDARCHGAGLNASPR
jgi:hypothetical protein